jgi:hypothetical protein
MEKKCHRKEAFSREDLLNIEPFQSLKIQENQKLNTLGELGCILGIIGKLSTSMILWRLICNL